MLKDFGSEIEANTWMLKLNKAIQKLFDQYSQEILVHHQQEDCGSPGAEEDEEDDDPLAEWDHYISCKKGQANNELDQYLKEELYPRKKELDILESWKINSSSIRFSLQLLVTYWLFRRPRCLPSPLLVLEDALSVIIGAVFLAPPSKL